MAGDAGFQDQRQHVTPAQAGAYNTLPKLFSSRFLHCAMDPRGAAEAFAGSYFEQCEK